MLQRRGTTAQWEDVKSTLILSSGEIGIIFDDPDLGNNGKFKVGDGVTVWEDLSFYLKDDDNADIYAKLIATQTFTGTQVLTPANAVSVPLVISGAGSQSANLQVWRNSSEVVKASVSYDGLITGNGGVFNANVSLAGNKVTNLGAPTSDQDAANKLYVDDAIAGLAWKAPVNLISASGLNTYINVPLTGSGGTIVLDGHTALTDTHNGYRLLLLAQTTTSDNGIYVYNQTGGTYTLTRATDSDSYTELKGASVFVEEGTNYGTSSWVQTNHYLTSFSGQNWVQFNGASQITAGTGLTKTGNTVNAIGTTDRITANADSIDIASTYVGQTSITTLGTVATGTWNADTISVGKGGTNITSYTTGDLLYASGTTQLSKLTAGTANYTLLSGGAGTAPSWGQVVTASLANASNTTTGVTYAKMQYVSAQYKVLGRISSGSGVVEELSADNLITMLNTGTSTISANRLTSSSGSNYGTSTDAARKDHTHTIDDLSDVIITGTPASRQVIKYNGTNWVNELPSGGISIGATSPSSPAAGDAWFDSTDGSLYVYYDDSTNRPSGTNLITNPSFETNATSWSGTNATVAQSSAQYYIGTKSMLVTPSTTTGKASFTATTVNGTTYRFSAYVFSTINKNLRVSITSPATNGTTTAVTYNTWTRLDVSFVANGTSTTVNIESIDSTDAFYVDAVMLEASATLNDYFDGSSLNSNWVGTAHASTSSTSGGQTKQWVQVRANSALEATILTRMSAVESRATNLEAANPVVVTSQAARSAIFPSPVQGNTVFRSDLGYMERYYAAYDAVTNPSGTTGTVGWYEYRGGAPLSSNYIINGAFDNWQRGTTSTQVDAYGSADRWVFKGVLARQTFTPGTSPSGSSTYYANLSWSSTYQYMSQRVEDISLMAGKTVTFSFYAKSSTTTTVYPRIVRNYGTGGSTQEELVFATTPITISSSWNRYFYTYTIPSLSGKTLGSKETTFMEFALYGTKASATTANFDIADVQIEEGPVATPFRRNQPNIQAELAACQRYYWRIKSDGTNANTPIPSGGAGIATTRAYITVTHPVAMRIPPTSLELSGMNVNTPGIEGFAITSAAIATNVSNNLITMVDCYVASGLTFRNVYRLETGSVSGYIGFSAEL